MSILKKIRNSYDIGSDFFNLTPETAEAFCDKMYSGYCLQFSNMTYLKKVEWILRVYFAAKKMVLSAIFYTQAEYIENHKLLNLQYYSAYYSLFNAFSANIILTPYIDLKVALKISHNKVFSEIKNYFIKHNAFESDSIDIFNNLRLTRELYSYHLPLGVDFNRKYPGLEKRAQLSDLRRILPISLRMSDLLSFLAYYAWEKNGISLGDEYEQYEDEVNKLFFSFITHEDCQGKYCIIGDDDYYRQGYVLNKFCSLIPIGWFITEKICEDLECNWVDDSEDEHYSFIDARKYLAATLESVI